MSDSTATPEQIQWGKDAEIDDLRTRLKAAEEEARLRKELAETLDAELHAVAERNHALADALRALRDDEHSDHVSNVRYTEPELCGHSYCVRANAALAGQPTTNPRVKVTRSFTSLEEATQAYREGER